MGVTQTPLTNHWVNTDTHTFLWGSHRHPLLDCRENTDAQHFITELTPEILHLNIGQTWTPNIFQRAQMDTHQINIGLTQMPIILSIGPNKQQDLPWGIITGQVRRHSDYQCAHTGNPTQYHWACTDKSPLKAPVRQCMNDDMR